MPSHSNTKKPLSEEYRRGFLDAHKSLSDMKERSDEDLAIYAISEAGHIAATSGGYWRIGFGADLRYWARWKWTTGHLEGRYTFGGGLSIHEALAQAAGRVHAVEAGKEKALVDTGYRKKVGLK